MKYEMEKRIEKLFLHFVLFLFPLFLGAETVEVIGTSDLHGDLKRFALLAPVIRRHTEAIRIDAGDLVQGDFVCDTLGGVPMIEALNALHYDLWVPGNHDFELGAVQLRVLKRRFNGTMAGAQWRFREEDVAPWCIIERKGIRCAFVALTEPGVEMRAALLKDILWRASEKAALKRALSEILRAKADAAILVFHASLFGSYGTLGKLLYDHPGIDAVLCAHSHQEIPGTMTAGAVVAQGGHRASAAVLFKLHFDGKKLHHVESSLLRPEKSADPELSAILRNAEKSTRTAAKEKLGVIESEAQFGQDAAEALRRAAGSDAALTAFGTIFPGALNGRRFYGLMPYRNRIVVVECSVAELRHAMSEYHGKRKLFLAGNLNRSQLRLALSDYLFGALGFSNVRVIKVTPLIERDVIRENLKGSVPHSGR